jgi:hypothetical protein
MSFRQLFVAHDLCRSVVSWQPLAAAGSERTSHGAVTVLQARNGDLIGRHGSAVRRAIARLAALGAVTWLVSLAGPTIVSRFCAIAILVVVVSGTRAFLVTTDASHVLAAGPSRLAYWQVTSEPERNQLTEALRLAARIAGNSARLGDLIDPADAARSVAVAVWDLAAVLQRQEQLRAVRAGLARHDAADLPTDSPAVRAGRAERARADEAWTAVVAESRRHLQSLRTAADAGDNLLREWDFGAEAKQARRSLDELGAAGAAAGAAGSGAHGEDLAARTTAVVAAYRQLAADHGHGLYE